MPKLVKGLFILLLIVVFGIISFVLYRQEQKLTEIEKKISLVSIPDVLSMAEVEEAIDRKIGEIEIPVATSTTVIQKVAAPAVKKTQPQEFIITLGSGSTTETGKWVDIESAQATIDSNNYPGLKAAYFEVVMHIPNAQGEVRAKLTETTLPFYYGEILKTQSGTGVTLSTPMFLKSGSRNYRVQLYNQIGTAVLDSARIRIVTE